MEKNVIYNEDCLVGMKKIPDDSIDMILCDLPYGTTANKWDSVIPFEPLWKEYERLIKPQGAIVLTANQGFTNSLINSNQAWYRYKWIWIKNNATNFVNAKNRPMSKYEEILVFSEKGTANHSGGERALNMNYFPQGLIRINKTMNGSKRGVGNQLHEWNMPDSYVQEFTNYPNDILYFDRDKDTWHPTQKPVALFEYLIRTYTKIGG